MSRAEMFQPPERGALDAAWSWLELPSLSVRCVGCRECVLSDGRKYRPRRRRAHQRPNHVVVRRRWQSLRDDGKHRELQPSPLHDARTSFATTRSCGQSTSLIVAGGSDRSHICSAEVFDEVLDRCGGCPAASVVATGQRRVCCISWAAGWML